jgi:FMN phosphatase YigB (HAD superfamily)
MFGDTVFEKYVYLDTGADKDNVLAEYAGSECWWVEDKPENAECGIGFGLNSILMNHEHNKTYNGSAIRVSNWKDIYNLVTKQS